MVYHGYPYTGNYPNTTWPGYSAFTYRFSEMHGPRQPAWEYYDDFIEWSARVQYIAQSGVPKIDLAFWLKKVDFFDVDSQYLPNDLQEAGYSYEYLSPDNFELPQAVVGDGVFAPERQAFKSLILRANDTLTVSGVQRLVDYANEGLPIIFSGGVSRNLTGYNETGTELVRSALAEILELENVHVVPYDDLAVSLSGLGITPRTQVSADRTLYTYWRDDANASVTYVFIYNDAWDSELGEGATTGSVTFETTGKPYVYDAWTGETSPVLAYQQSADSTTICFSLAGNQSTIIGFHHDEDASSHAISFPDEVHSATVDGDQLSIKAGIASQPVLISNGTSITLPSAAASTQLDTWSLIIESWSPPADPEVDQTRAALSNSTFNITHLQPWNEISDSLRNVSGRGFYTTTFTWPPTNGSADGAVLELGAIYNTARVWVNRQQLPPLDPTDARADVGEYLQDGTNKVQVVLSTPLGNALRTFWTEVKSSGTVWLGPEPVEHGYGLVSNVTVVPYLTTTIQL